MSWKITVENKTGDEGREGETVEFMIFQTVQQPNEYSYSAAFSVEKVAFPGKLGPIHLPEEVTFCIIENVSNLDETDAGVYTDKGVRPSPYKLKPTIMLPFKVVQWLGNSIVKVAENVYDLVDTSPQERHTNTISPATDTHLYEGPSASMQSLRVTGPFKIKFGDIATVSQKNQNDAPQVTSKSFCNLQNDSFKIVNESGNVKPLEFALYKNESKLLSCKEVHPNDDVSFSPVLPAIFIMKRPGSLDIEKDFKAVSMMNQATRIELHPGQLHVMIGIYKKRNSELVFKPI